VVGTRSCRLAACCYKFPFNGLGAVARRLDLKSVPVERVLRESLHFLGSSWGHLDPGCWWGGGGAQKQRERARNM
jgi:hypothetical protein